jgi:hypothetical protein
LPFLPFGTPVTEDEHWRNILHDVGYVPEQVLTSVPTTMDEVLLGLDKGLYQTSMSTYGSGVDGPLQFSALANGAGSVTCWNGTTITASSNTYTLTQDLWLGQSVSQNATTGVYTLATPTIASGVTINSNGFRIFCQGILVNNGTIESNGANGAVSVAGAALGYSSTISATTVGSAGGAGGANNGTVGGNQTVSLGGAGGAGGASNNGSATVGGAGGLAARPAATIQLPFSLPYALAAKGTGSSTTWQVFTAGSGGGGGAGDGANTGGGGGGGGGIIMIAAQRLTGTGSITANGGAGGANNTASAVAGGGGGGGGGLVIIVSRSVQTAGVNTGGPLVYSSATTLANMTITAAGGAGGAGIGANGAAGANGSAGIVVLIPD